MKKILILLTVIFTVSTTHSVYVSNLVELWHLNENTGTSTLNEVDSSNGTLDGDYEWHAPIYGASALTTNGDTGTGYATGGRIVGTNNAPSGNSPRTVMFRFYFLSNSPDDRCLYSQNGDEKFFIWLSLRDGNQVISVWTSTTGGDYDGATTLTTDTTYFIAVTYNGNLTSRLYINGVEDGNSPWTHIGQWATSAAPSTIGRMHNYQYPANAVIDELAVTNDCKSGSDIADIYSADEEISNTLPVSPTSVTELFHFNENTGSITKEEMFPSTAVWVGSNNSWVAGKTGFGYAINYDGGNGWTRFKSPFHDWSNEITVSLWVKQTATGVYQMPIVQGIQGQDDTAGRVFAVEFTDSDTLFFLVQDGTTNNLVSYSVGSSIYNAWHLITCTASGTTQQIYIDGEPKGTGGTGIGTINNTASADLGIGYGIYWNGYPWNGAIDEVFLSSTCWTSQQVLDFYNSDAPYNPSPGPTPSGPGAPAVVRDGTGTDISSTTSTSELSANWDASTSTVVGYRYAIGTSQGGTETIGWQTIGDVLGVTKTGLSLSVGTTYYFGVKAYNGVGDSSATNSDGQFVYTLPPIPPLTPVVGSRPKTIIMQ